MIDTLAYARRVQAGGLPQEQAEALATALDAALEEPTERLVTRDYLDKRLAELELRIIDRMTSQTRWLVGLFVAIGVAVVGLYFR